MCITDVFDILTKETGTRRKDSLSSSEDKPLNEPVYTEDCDDIDPEDYTDADEAYDLEIKIGSWVLVKYPTKKSVKDFVAQIIEKDNEGIFKRPLEEDIETMDDQVIIRVLPGPSICRRGNFKFSVDFSGLNL